MLRSLHPVPLSLSPLPILPRLFFLLIQCDLANLYYWELFRCEVLWGFWRIELPLGVPSLLLETRPMIPTVSQALSLLWWPGFPRAGGDDKGGRRWRQMCSSQRERPEWGCGAGSVGKVLFEVDLICMWPLNVFRCYDVLDKSSTWEQ